MTDESTTEDVRVEVLRIPPPYYEGASKDLGHVKATGHGVTVSLPCSFALLDDPNALDHYIKTRLLLFHKIELDRVRSQ